MVCTRRSAEQPAQRDGATMQNFDAMQDVSSSEIAITVTAQAGRVELLTIRRVWSDHCVRATSGHLERLPHDETKPFADSMVMAELST